MCLVQLQFLFPIFSICNWLNPLMQNPWILRVMKNAGELWEFLLLMTSEGFWIRWPWTVAFSTQLPGWALWQAGHLCH
jgi:hypothetical protein